MRLSKSVIFGSVMVGISAGIASAMAAGSAQTVKGYAPYIVGGVVLSLGNLFVSPHKADEKGGEVSVPGGGK